MRRSDGVRAMRVARLFRRACAAGGMAAAGLMCAEALSGCLVAGYSSRSGFFVWPGSIALTVIVLLVIFLLRRGR